ncbi:MAG TPA: glycosyltransferase [Polyangiaceae bacterium]|nr:glycosyltransferase [Polyangiaceae bacterium]
MTSEPLDLSVIVPCYNEEANIPELVLRVLAVLDAGQIRGELLLVDDGSRDRTAEVIREQMRLHGERVVGLFHRSNRGLVEGWRTGTKAARGANIVIIDADLQYLPEDILRLYRKLMETSVDIVQGSRSSIGRPKDDRYNLSRALNWLLNSTFGMNLRDNKSGFICCAREVMLDLLNYRGGYSHWQSFLMVAAHAKGYSYTEVQTLFESRLQGKSSLDGRAYRVAAENLVDLAKAFVEYRVQAEPHDVSRQFLARADVKPEEPLSRRADPVRWRSYMSTFERSHWFITKNVERYYETLSTTQWLSAEQIRELQNEKLRRLIRHAYRSVPFYRARMQELKLKPEDIRTQEDLAKLPLLTKDHVRKHLHFDMVADGASHADMLRISTSGSTGEPFICYADRAQVEFRWAATLRSQEWTGYRFGDPCVRLWHQTIGMTDSQTAKEKLDAWFARRTFVPVFEMTEDGLAEIVRLMSDKQPVLIDGYAEAFNFLGQYLEARGGLNFKPKALMSSAQTLPRRSRQLIEAAFGCPVFDKYGSREFSGVAYESEAHDGHLIVAEGYVVEVLVDGRPALPGEVGEVVITDLNNYCMPFIRYRIGDLAEAVDNSRPSSCGRGLPRLGEIQGRVQSIIQGTDGHFVPGSFFPHLLKDYDHAIKRFQVVQDEPGAIKLRLVKAPRYTDDTLEEIKACIHRYLGEGLRIDVIFEDHIEMVRTGKHLASVSRLPIDFQKQAPKSAVRMA